MIRGLAPRRLLAVSVAAFALAAVVTAGPSGSSAATNPRTVVQVSPGHIVVVAPNGARAVVQRQPFAMTFLDPRGRVVLREVPARGRPLRLAPATQLEFGTHTPAPPTLYAPLGFLVGRQDVSQEPAGQWEGTLRAVSRAGVEYSAQAVLAACAVAGGVRLTLATNDPTHRRLVVTLVATPSGDAFSVHVRVSSNRGVATMFDSFRSTAGEAFHGFGGRHNSLDQHGAEFYNWLQQENVSSGSATGWTAPVDQAHDRFLFPNGPEAAYYVQSSFVSSAGYGFFLDRDGLSHWRLDSDRPDAWQSEVSGPVLDYLVVPGSYGTAVTRLTAMTGRQPAPPVWSVGSILDREVRFPPESPAVYAAEVQSDIDNLDRFHLHVDGYRIEAWQGLPRPVLRHLIAELRARGIHPLLYFRAFVGLDATGTDDPAAYRAALAHGYVATHADGRPYVFISNFNAPAALIDFTNPAAVRWWQGRIDTALNLGADGFMLDFGEQTQSDMHFHDGANGAEMHNRYPLLYDRATRTAVDAYERTHSGRHVFVFTRAGYTGRPGNAAYESANFPGDETTDWTRSAGLAAQTTDMLNRAIGGAYGYSTDIGGYFDIGPYQPTTNELFLRWAEWSALSPFFRLHGSVRGGVHMPWTYGPATLKAYKALTTLHLRARALILSLWREADRTGIPVTRPLWLADPDDPRAARQDQEWLLGPDVLVAPVVVQGARSRRVFFPPGCWHRPGAPADVHGPTSRTVTATLVQLPYFVRCASHPFTQSG